MLGILHLSDIHIKEKNDYILNNITTIYDASKNILINTDKIILLISGDIANTGQSEEYDIAFEFLYNLKEKLESYCHKEVYVLMIPGNHDCNFEDEETNEIRKAIIETIKNNKTNEVKDSFIKKCCSIQDSFWEFKELFRNESFKEIFPNNEQDRLICINEIELKEYKVFLVGLNVAWMSQKHEEPNLYFPLDKYKNILKSLNGMVIVYLHQPTRWCHPDDGNDLDNILNKYADIVITGHEHMNKSIYLEDEEDRVAYIKSGALQDRYKLNSSKFNVLTLDSTLNKLNVSTFEYSDENCLYSKISSKPIELNNIKKNKIELRKEYKEFIKDIGANICKFNDKKLYLQDIYVYPDIELINNDNLENSRLFNSEIFKQLEEKNYININSYEKYGKTSLAKMLFNEYINQGKIPIFIDSKQLKFKSKDNIEDIINKQFKKEYTDESYIYYEQEDINKIIILIDDFSEICRGNDLKELFLQKLTDKYYNVILFSNININVIESIDSGIDSIINTKFKTYEIHKFRNKLKNELIHKWNMLGEEDQDKNELLEKDDYALKLINSIQGKNFIPSTPFYITVLLMSIDAGKPNNFQDSSYAFYYEFLINKSLCKICSLYSSSQNSYIIAIKTFLINLSKYIFDKGEKIITIEELRRFHSDYCEQYGISENIKILRNFEVLIKSFVKESIMKEHADEKIGFSYRYIYYFFIGKYLAENITKENTKIIISNIIDKLYVEENANILMFTIYNTSDDFLFCKIIEKSKSIFHNYDEVKLDNDLNFIETIQLELAPMTSKKIDIFNSRKQELDKIDKAEIKYEQEVAIDKDIEYEDNYNNEQLDALNEMNMCFKSMEILGQILKNYWGKLQLNQQKEIGKELYSLGLRGLKASYKVTKDSTDKLSQVFALQIKNENRKLRKHEIEEKTKRMIYMFIYFFTRGFLVKIGTCIGDRNLDVMYKEIYKENQCPSIELINLFIRLEYYNKPFPFDVVNKIYTRYLYSDIRNLVLRSFIKKYLYMNCTDNRESDKICSLFRFDNKDQKKMLLGKSKK